MERELLLRELELHRMHDGESLVMEAEKSETIARHDTDLNAPYVGGNFNFLYNAGASEATITFVTGVVFKEKFTDSQKKDFFARMRKAALMWDESAEIQVMDKSGKVGEKIRLRFKIQFVREAKHANKLTYVHGSGYREKVMANFNVAIDSTTQILAHELGHVWGSEDEYDAKGVSGWFQKRLPVGHVGPGSPFLKDKLALMNEGDEFRGRYFTHIGREILKAFRKVKKYHKDIIGPKGKRVAQVVIGRVVLLKKNVNGDPPYTTDQTLNPVHKIIQIAWRAGDSETEFESPVFEQEIGPARFYEDVIVRSNETLVMLAAAYGHDPDDWRQIWNDPRNADLVRRRRTSDNIRAGDRLQMPIPFRITEQSLNPDGASFRMSAKRSGKEGCRLSWVQTVYAHNQPQFGHHRPFPAFSVDLPTEDDKPYYWTQVEIDQADRNDGRFPQVIFDTPFRNPPAAPLPTTTWRAVTSLCVTTGQRVSIWDTFVWGVNFGADGVNTRLDIRPATPEERAGHLNLLRKKVGRSNRSYQSMGWTFRDRNGV